MDALHPHRSAEVEAVVETVVVDFAAYKAAREARASRVEWLVVRAERRRPTPREVAHRREMLKHLSGTTGAANEETGCAGRHPVSLVSRGLS